MRPGRRLKTIGLGTVALAATGLAIPTHACEPPGRTLRYQYTRTATEADIAGMGGAGIGCTDGMDCFTVRANPDERSLTLEASTAGVPVYGVYNRHWPEWADSPGWAGPSPTPFCGHVTIDDLDPGEAVSVYFDVIQNPFAAPFDGPCLESPAGTFTATFH